MLGLIVAIVMLFFGVNTDTVLLAFIAMQVFVRTEIEVARRREERAAKRHLASVFGDFEKGFKRAINERDKDK